MQLSSDQEQAMADALAFARAPYVPEPYFVIHGLAGTGKSFLLSHLVKAHPNVTLTAFTGKAASVLRKRVQVPVITLHSAIYNFRGMAEDEYDPSIQNPIFVLKGESFAGRLIAIDEVGMVGRRVAQDAIDTGARLLCSGDPGQLPPVRDSVFFDAPDVTLTKVHRQAWDSSIIRQAHNIRNNGYYEPDGNDFRVIAKAQPEDILAADAILCWRNRTRIKLNARKRELLGLSGPLRAGEPVMCLKNDHALGLYNGAVYTLAADTASTAPGISVETEDQKTVTHVELATIEGHDPKFETRKYEDDWLPFAPGYAFTTHKSQGSEYENVLLFDEYDRDDDDRSRWLYTGVTRAKSRCTVVSWR